MHGIFQLDDVGGGKRRMRLVGQSESLSDVLYQQSKIDGENVFYSVASIKNIPAVGESWKNKAGDFESLSYVFFDVDGLEAADLDDAVERLIDPLIVSWAGESAERFYVDSGHGVHILVSIPPVDDAEWISRVRPAYRHLAVQLELLLLKHGLPGEVDLKVWESSRVLRVPGTVNAKKDKAAVPCRLILSEGESASEQLRLMLESYQPPAEERRDAGSGGDVERVLQAVKHIDCGHYWHCYCPFHPEKQPSFVIYKNNPCWGYDLHCEQGSPGWRQPMSHIWCQAKYGAVDADKLAEFDGQAGGSPTSAVAIIERWAATAFEFTCVIADDKRSELYSKNWGRTVSVGEFKSWCDTPVLKSLLESDEANSGKTPMGLAKMPHLYREMCVPVYRGFMQRLPRKVDCPVSSTTGLDISPSLERLLRVAFYRQRPVVSEDDGRRRTTSLLAEIQNMSEVPEIAGWHQVPSFGAAVCYDGNGISGVALTYSVLVGADGHCDLRQWGWRTPFVEAGVGSRKQVRIGTSRFHALVLPGEYINGLLDGADGSDDEVEDAV